MYRFNLFAASLMLLALAACDDGASPGETPGEPQPEPPVAANLALSVDPAARACEVMLVGSVDAAFDATVEGRQLRRGDQLAVAFTAKADAALGVAAVTLSSADAANLIIESGTCFDVTGQPLADANLALIGR